MWAKFIFLSLWVLIGTPAALSQSTTTYSYDAHGRLLIAEDTSHSDLYYDFDDAHNLTYVGVDIPPPNSNNIPTCNDISVTVPNSQTSTHTFPIPECTDPDGDTLVLTAVTQPSTGASVSIDTNDRILYSNLQIGLNVTTYTVSDGNGGVTSGFSTVNRQSGGGWPPN